MCLRIRKPYGFFRNKCKTRKTAWKVIGCIRGNRISAFMNTDYNSGDTVISDRKSKEIDKEEKVIVNGVARGISRGIHVFITINAAKKAMSIYSDMICFDGFRYNGGVFEVIELEVDPDDWVSDGHHDEAVYMKVKVV